METSLTERFGELIRRLRLDAAMSQEELAHVAGLHPTYISRLEGGKRTPSIEVAEQLAKALSVKTSALFAQLEERVPRSRSKDSR